ncbi:YraN family protein [Candidatus Endomicrobiellum trichonymphae]|uniref:YraN family protein n=1 Tax=Endomicrobium trichonymphae TaxID=1408204 RepID=UPI000BAA6E03
MILTTNFRTNFGEIDIIAKHNDTIVFIEAKYRKSSYSGTPQENVKFRNRRIKMKIRKAMIVIFSVVLERLRHRLM